MRIVRDMSLALMAALVAAPAVAQDTTTSSDTIAVTTAAVTVRAQPMASAGVVAHLPASTLVRLYSCTAGWCRVAAQQARTGYALEEYLNRHPATTTSPQGRGYVNSKGEWVRSPITTPDNRPPNGAKAHCRDGTYSFSQSRRGTCSHHGGVAEWL